MALDKPYHDIPGTTIFDAEQARKGYHLNQFCMSLMKAENRERFKADERAYLDEWPMTEEQKQAVLDRDSTAASRWAATSTSSPRLSPPTASQLPADGRQHDRHDRRGVPQHDDQWRAAGNRCRGRQCASNRRGAAESEWPGSPPASTPRTCRPSAPRSTSARPGSPTGQPLFKGYEFSKQWMQDEKPDVIFLVYNDHATAFSLEMIPTFAIGCGERVRHRRRGLGAAAGARGHRPSGACLRTSRSR